MGNEKEGDGALAAETSPAPVSSSAGGVGGDLKLCERGPGLRGLSWHQLSRCRTLGSLMAFTCDPGWTSGLGCGRVEQEARRKGQELFSCIPWDHAPGLSWGP